MAYRSLSSVAAAIAISVPLIVSGHASAIARDTPHQSQVPASSSGLILGQVVDATTNKPISHAVVTLTGGVAALRTAAAPGQPAQRVLTDADGGFFFRALPKGTYAFSTTAPGYLSGGYGQRRPEGTTQPFLLEEGQRVGDVVIRLWRESVIGGIVTDDTGAPVPGVIVLVNRRVTVNGRVELRTQQYGKRTDDRGVYSQGGLPPGDYVVAVPSGMTVARVGPATVDASALASYRASGSEALASGGATRSAGVVTRELVVLPGGLNSLAGQLPLTTLSDGRVVTYATTFHPGAGTLTTAGVITLGVGDERTNIDVHLRAVSTASVSGTLLGPNGPAPDFAVHLIPAYAVHTSLERNFESAVTSTDQAGRFVFPAVAPGAYSVLAWRKPSRNGSLIEPLSAEPSLWAEVPVVVEAAPATITLNLRPGAALKGRIILEGTLPPPRPQQFQAVLGSWLQPPWPLAFNAGPIAETRITAAWDFIKEGMPPGRYALNTLSTFAPPPGWFLKSATHEGRDLLTSPLVLDGQDVSGIVITFSDRPAALAGLVTDSMGKPDATAGVLVVPADYQGWVQNGRAVAVARAVPTSQTGAYAVPDLPPGDYLILATSAEAIDDWPTSLTQTLIAQATRVTLASGTATRADLRRRQ